MPVSLDPITSAGLVLCEGSDDLALLEWIRTSLGIEPETLRIQSLGGRPALHDNLMALPLRDGEHRLRALGIVSDADREDGQGAFRRVRDDLRTTQYVVPTAPSLLVSGAWAGGASLSVGVFILPDNQSSGALEELCLAALGNDPSLGCVDELM